MDASDGARGEAVLVGGHLVRRAVPADLPAMNDLQQHGFGGRPGVRADIVEAELDRPDRWLWVGVRSSDQQERVVACARLSLGGAAGGLPAGHHLGGVVVHPDHRGRGLGGALIDVRIEEAVRCGADHLYYVGNSRNVASVRAHERAGFVEVARPVSVPGVTFEDGVGVLHRLEIVPTGRRSA